jgi:hypothetical protein
LNHASASCQYDLGSPSKMIHYLSLRAPLLPTHHVLKVHIPRTPSPIDTPHPGMSMVGLHSPMGLACSENVTAPRTSQPPLWAQGHLLSLIHFRCPELSAMVRR